MAAWWERFPGRLEVELEDFRTRGLEFELDESLFRDAGRVLLRGSFDHDGESVELEILYPDLFPYLRPEVYAPGLSLVRHQNPALHNLCLLDRDTSAWEPEETGAWLVAERVPKLLSLFEQGPEAMAAGEVAQGEPVSAYFEAQAIPGAVIFVPGEALELDSGLRVGSGRLHFAPDVQPALAVRALLGELVVRSGSGKKNKLIARADEPLARRFGGAELPMRWVRLEGAPDGYNADGILAAAGAVQPGFEAPPWQNVAGGQVGVTGVVFPEEVGQGIYADAWLFAVRHQRVSGGQQHVGAYVIRGERLTNADLGARIPSLTALRDSVVAQIGLGALGAPLAFELARNQTGTLRLLEHDRVEVAQTVRWPLGLSAVGYHKLQVVGDVIDREYPYTQLDRFPHRLGETAFERQHRTEGEIDLVERFLKGASIVIDATAELGVQYLISDFARERDLSQVYLSATDGARGGQIALIVPGSGGCWFCWKQHALKGTIPLPPSEPHATVQPRGCAAPTFTGASFDLLPIVAHAARVTTAALGSGDGIESTAWICDIPASSPDPPTWSTHPITIHPDCPLCMPIE